MKKVIAAVWDESIKNIWDIVKKSSITNKTSTGMSLTYSYNQEVIFEFLNECVEVKGATETLNTIFDGSFLTLIKEMNSELSLSDNNHYWVDFFDKLLKENQDLAKHSLLKLNNDPSKSGVFDNYKDIVVSLNKHYAQLYPDDLNILWSSKTEIKQELSSQKIISMENKPSPFKHFLDLVEISNISKEDAFMGKKTSEILTLLESDSGKITYEVRRNLDMFNKDNSVAIHILLSHVYGVDTDIENKLWEIDKDFLLNIDDSKLINDVFMGGRKSWLNKSFKCSFELLKNFLKDDDFTGSQTNDRRALAFLKTPLERQISESYTNFSKIKSIYSDLIGFAGENIKFRDNLSGINNSLSALTSGLINHARFYNDSKERIFVELVGDPLTRRVGLHLDQETETPYGNVLRNMGTSPLLSDSQKVAFKEYIEDSFYNINILLLSYIDTFKHEFSVDALEKVEQYKLDVKEQFLKIHDEQLRKPPMDKNKASSILNLMMFLYTEENKDDFKDVIQNSSFIYQMNNGVLYSRGGETFEFHNSILANRNNDVIKKYLEVFFGDKENGEILRSGNKNAFKGLLMQHQDVFSNLVDENPDKYIKILLEKEYLMKLTFSFSPENNAKIMKNIISDKINKVKLDDTDNELSVPFKC